MLAARGLREGVLAATNSRRASVVADPVGGDVFDEPTRCTAFAGWRQVLGFASGRSPTLAINRPLVKGFSVAGMRAGEYGRQGWLRGRPRKVGRHKSL